MAEIVAQRADGKVVKKASAAPTAAVLTVEQL